MIHASRMSRLKTALRCAIFFALMVFFVPLAAAVETSLSPREWRTIQDVISRQLAAFREERADRAFSYATPALRTQFRDADTFMTMVQTGYAVLLHARHTEFLQGAVIDHIVVQPLRVTGKDSSVTIALYTMEKQPDGRWRIAGCRLAPTATQAI